MLANEKLTNQHFFKTQCECYVITLKCIISIFLNVKNQTFRHLRKFSKNVTKQRLFFALSKKKFPPFQLAAAKSSLLHWTDNFMIRLTSLTSAPPVWTVP